MICLHLITWVPRVQLTSWWYNKTHTHTHTLNHTTHQNTPSHVRPPPPHCCWVLWWGGGQDNDNDDKYDSCHCHCEGAGRGAGWRTTTWFTDLTVSLTHWLLSNRQTNKCFPAPERREISQRPEEEKQTNTRNISYLSFWMMKISGYVKVTVGPSLCLKILTFPLAPFIYRKREIILPVMNTAASRWHHRRCWSQINVK